MTRILSDEIVPMLSLTCCCSFQATEYAKHVPKPKAHSKQYNTLPSHELPANAGRKVLGVQPLSQSPRSLPESPTKEPNHWAPRQPDVQPLSQIHLQDLEDLQRRHEDDRRTVAEIQYKMQQAA